MKRQTPGRPTLSPVAMGSPSGTSAEVSRSQPLLPMMMQQQQQVQPMNQQQMQFINIAAAASLLQGPQMNFLEHAMGPMGTNSFPRLQSLVRTNAFVRRCVLSISMRSHLQLF